jgi:hypothetical protein
MRTAKATALGIHYRFGVARSRVGAAQSHLVRRFSPPRVLPPNERPDARGVSLLELVAAVGVTTLIAGLTGSALSRLARATAVQSARVRVMNALLEARRLAYATESTVEVTGAIGDAAVVIRTTDGESRAAVLPAGTAIMHFPASGHVRFFASGLADNATVTVGSAEGTAAEEQIIVNQRGLVR